MWWAIKPAFIGCQVCTVFVAGIFASPVFAAFISGVFLTVNTLLTLALPRYLRARARRRGLDNDGP